MIDFFKNHTVFLSIAIGGVVLLTAAGLFLWHSLKGAAKDLVREVDSLKG